MSNDARAAQIRLLVFDVDGVLTDGSLWYGPTGEVTKRFDVKDGHAIVLARLVGLPSAILTARTSSIVEARARELKIDHVLQGKREKLPAFDELCAKVGLEREQVAYMGDDVNDLPVLLKAGLSACPADAVDEVREAVHLVSSRSGGHGAVREFVEFILKRSGRWAEALAHCGVVKTL